MPRKRTPKPTVTETHNIHPQLMSLKVEVGLLQLDPDNARGHNEPNIDSIANSLREFGQRKPIVVRKGTMVVTAGNGTLIAAKREGWTHIAALVADDNDMQAMAWALADNRAGELASWDYGRLVTQFGILQGGGVDVAALGWDDRELAMLTQSAFTPEAIAELPGDKRGEGNTGGAGQVGGTSTDQDIDKESFKELVALYHRYHPEGEELGAFVLRAVHALVKDASPVAAED